MLKLRIRIPGKSTATHELVDTDKEHAEVVLRGFSGSPAYFSYAQELEASDFWSSFAQTPFSLDYEVAEQEYTQLVKQAIEQIHLQPELHKVVLSRSSYFLSDQSSPEATFKALEENYSDCTVFALSHPELGDWMGATPEILLEKTLEGHRSMSLAGTRLKGIEQWGEKELTEQQYVTEEIYSTLELFGGSVTCSEPRTRGAGPVEHIQSWVHTTSDQLRVVDVLEALHPTPAVCGTPTNMARALIHQLEQHNRELYTGYIALLGDHPTASVLLRTMKWHKGGVRFFAGGGITKDSVPLDEWNETQYKMAALKDLLC